MRKVFRSVLKAAGLPPHFSPHGLRHTFAALLLQQGEGPAYVQRLFTARPRHADVLRKLNEPLKHLDGLDRVGMVTRDRTLAARRNANMLTRC